MIDFKGLGFEAVQKQFIRQELPTATPQQMLEFAMHAGLFDDAREYRRLYNETYIGAAEKAGKVFHKLKLGVQAFIDS